MLNNLKSTIKGFIGDRTKIFRKIHYIQDKHTYI